jgi:hypothetical protein
MWEEVRNNMDSAGIQLLLQAVSTVGFPIVVCGYVLMKLNKTIENNTAIMIRVAEKLDIPSPQEGVK